MFWILILSLLGISLIAAFRGNRLLPWTAAMTAVLAGFAVFTTVSTLAIVILSVLFAAFAIPLNYKPIRRRWLSEPFLAIYRKMLPTLSETEQVALEAGTVGWEGELFTGNPNWNTLLAQQWPELTEAEQAFVDGPVEVLSDMLNPWRNAHELADLPPEIWDFLKEHRFLGMIIPTEYGGLGFSAIAHRAVLQKVSSVCPLAGTTIAVPNSLGPAELLVHYGTQEQKDYYLPRLASGEEIPCFGLTGPTAGSDATSIPDTGIICKGKYDGKNIVGIRLNFDKRYITLAPVATIIGLAFRLYDPDGLVGDRKDLGISLALVPREAPGMEIGKRHIPLYMPFSNGPIRGKDVFVPLDSLVGGIERAGEGWRMLIELLSVGRAITLPSSSTGGAKLSALSTGAYARIRKQFNLPIGRFEGVEEALARLAGYTYATSALSRMTASAVDMGEKPAVPSAIAKYHATEMTRKVVSDAMDVHGGKGIIMGPRNYLGRGWMGLPIWITVEGANILTRSMMIFGQGAIRCHPYVLQEMSAARLEDKARGLEEFDHHLFRHIGYSISNGVRSMLLGLSLARFAVVPSDRKTARYYRKLTRYSASLAFASDIAMLTFGGKLKYKERLSGRLGDVLSHLYICSAMLKRFEMQGRPSADQPILAWAFHDAIYKMQTALASVVDNFPSRAIRVLLAVTIFPLGRHEKQPGDRLGHKVAQLLLSPSETRDRLTNGVFISESTGNPIGLLEAALPRVIATEPLERRILKAQSTGELDAHDWQNQLEEAVTKSIITDVEAKELKAVREMVTEIIAVDEFESSVLRMGTSSIA
ncbi:MAG: acyl-CoA dehydrogenase [Gammaproteobacteria bacterium]|nr:MAG: acyl-CoA dehydrogenase [Gammaproteobacteria bacterium]